MCAAGLRDGCKEPDQSARQTPRGTLPSLAFYWQRPGPALTFPQRIMGGTARMSCCWRTQSGVSGASRPGSQAGAAPWACSVANACSTAAAPSGAGFGMAGTGDGMAV